MPDDVTVAAIGRTVPGKTGESAQSDFSPVGTSILVGLGVCR